MTVLTPQHILDDSSISWWHAADRELCSTLLGCALTRMEMTGMGTLAAAMTVPASTGAPEASVKTAASPAGRSSGGLKKTGKGDPPMAEPFISTVS